MGFPHVHRATNPTPRCHLEVEKRKVSLKRRGGIPWEAMEPALQGPHSQHWGENVHPKSPPGSPLRPTPMGSPFSGITATAAALCLSVRGWPAAPEILLPSCKRKKKLIASSARSSSTAAWGWRNRRGAEPAVLSPWGRPRAGSGCWWGAGRGHAAADRDPARGLGGRKVSGAGQDEVLGVRCAPPACFACSGSFFSHLIAGCYSGLVSLLLFF